MPVLVRVLGPLEVTCAAGPAVIRGAKERALLVRLALEAGRIVSSDRLVEALWDEDPPASAVATLRVLVSRVRKAMADAGSDGVIHTRPTGYLLAADEVDLLRFELLAARGRTALADERADEAAAMLAEALALWRGDSLAEVSSDHLHAEGVRLAQARVAALEARLEADLACGRHADVLDELQSLAIANPLRENTWAMWVTALYRCDRQADALSTYHQLRRNLAEELGIDPSARLRRLQAAILAQDPELRMTPQRATPATTDVVPFPPPLNVVERAPFTGRDNDLRSAQEAWDSTAAGQSHVVLVMGEAGIGKSRLVRELARDIHQRGGAVAYGRCDEDLAIPYRPFVECLSHLIAHLPYRAFDSVDPQSLGELTRLIPALADRRPGLPAPTVADSPVEQYLLFGATAALLAAATRESPILMILDDLHWADRPTLLLLRHLAGLNLPGVLLIATCRTSLHSDSPLTEVLGDLAREASVRRITPQRLSAAESETLVRALAHERHDDAVAEMGKFVHRQTEGSPFYLVEMLSHLRETNAVARRSDDGFELSRVGLPDTIRAVVRARVARLGTDAARLLSVAAVVGQEFETDVLAGAGELEVDHVLDLLELVTSAALVEEAAGRPGLFRFTHALIQQTLYGDLGGARRTRIHARVAQTMDRIGGRAPGEVAFHFLAGITPETTATALRYARAAGAAALNASAPDEAVRWYRAALNALPPPADDVHHARALVDLGMAQRQAGQANFRETLREAARIAQHNGAGDLLIEAALGGSRSGFSSLGAVDAEKVAVIEAAVAVAAPDSPERARLLAVLAGELSWHPDHTRRIALAREAVALARRTGDRDTLLFAILQPGPALSVPQTAEERVQLFREAVDLERAAGRRPAAVLLLAHTLLEAVCPDDVDADVDAAVRAAEELGEPWVRVISLLIRSCLAIAHGDLERAEDDLANVLRIGQETGQPDTQEMYDATLYLLRWHQGRLAEILPRLRVASTSLPDHTGRASELAYAEVRAGDRLPAQALLDAAADGGFNVFYGPSWLGSMCRWGDVAAELRDTAAAAVLEAKLAPWAHLFAADGPLPVGAVSLSLARLAVLREDSSAAERHFAEAMRVNELLRMPFGMAETALSWGRVLLQSDPGRARHLLSNAAALAARHGFKDVSGAARKTVAAL